ncbi:MAG: hypothetical protein JRN37_09655 [Nitrososphaerota archaeon]|nr:hypothetical protein [Nitrososphaerota archaeon]MDG7039394.1 hypothetical protein [Nitrososphaerota archaeon]
MSTYQARSVVDAFHIVQAGRPAAVKYPAISDCQLNFGPLGFKAVNSIPLLTRIGPVF